MPGKDAFGEHARDYSRLWSSNPIAQLQRSRLWELIDRLVPEKVDFVDLGCGIGDDVVLALERGHSVVAIDESEGMLDELRRRLPTVEALRGDARQLAGLDCTQLFDVALLNFGVINCIERPAEVAATLSRHIRPGGWAFVVWMPRWAWGEIAYFGLRGRFGAAIRRGVGRSSVDVGGHPVATWFHRRADLCADFRPWFSVEHCESLAALLPPPRQVGTRGAVEDWLIRLDERVRRLSWFGATGDHVVVAFRRRVAVSSSPSTASRATATSSP
jgi:SAM-dependent methyltransferase